jgi:Xaa-Pro aminopeptidase
MKALKNDAELRGMHEAHLADGAAVARFLCWLEGEVAQGRSLTEVEIEEVVLRFRAQNSSFLQPSFPTIAGVGANGAVIHYHARPGPQLATLGSSDMLLLDSGGQYIGGTTDVTRTLHTGRPSDRQREIFTCVLKGHIAVDTCVFPEATPGFTLDILARTALWRRGLDFNHGVGHGVGAALNVHEGPHSISKRYGNKQPLLAGMIVSNEPGYYERGAFGIRIENLLYVQPHTHDSMNESEKRGVSFLSFGRLTKIPIQKKLIDTTLLSDYELQWINNYHAEVGSASCFE